MRSGAVRTKSAWGEKGGHLTWPGIRQLLWFRESEFRLQTLVSSDQRIRIVLLMMFKETEDFIVSYNVMVKPLWTATVSSIASSEPIQATRADALELETKLQAAAILGAMEPASNKGRSC